MTRFFYIKAKVGKFFANVCSLFVRDKERRHQLRARLNPLNPERCVSYLQRHYTQASVESAVLSGVTAISHASSFGSKSPVWVCWLQGRENAPALVQNCIDSIERQLRQDQQLVIVTADNYADYVTMPSVIVDKWRQGVISNTHFSDLFRIHALACHGGCWIDATCLLMRPIPDEYLSAPLFIMHTHGEFLYTYIQSCFMCCQPNHYVVRKWCAAMDAYWTQEDCLINYFTLHLMFVALLRSDAHFKQQFDQVPVVSDQPLHLLLYSMMRGDAYDAALISKARQSVFMQKLTYKFPAALLDDPQSLASWLSQSHLIV